MVMQIINTEIMETPNLMEDDGRGATCLAVLTRDHIGKWAVYSGIVSLPWSNKLSDLEWQEMKLRAAQLVMHRGLKLTHRKALAYFPALPGNEYRD